MSICLSNRVDRCEVIQKIQPVVTDHYSIVTEINISIEQVIESQIHNFRTAGWDKFTKKLMVEYNNHRASTDNSSKQITENIVISIQLTIKEVISLKLAPKGGGIMN